MKYLGSLGSLRDFTQSRRLYVTISEIICCLTSLIIKRHLLAKIVSPNNLISNLTLGASTFFLISLSLGALDVRRLAPPNFASTSASSSTDVSDTKQPRMHSLT